MAKWDELTLTRKLIEFAETGRYPSLAAYPGEIRLSSKTWGRLNEVWRLTKKDKKEHLVLGFAIGKRLLISPTTTGSKDRVISSQTIRLKRLPMTRRDYYKEQVMVDGKVISEETIHGRKAARKPKITLLFTVHTHPPHFDGYTNYSFFSKTDIESLMDSKLAASGLLTDKLHLVVKTRESVSNEADLPEKILETTLTDTLHLVHYTADLNHYLKKSLF